MKNVIGVYLGDEEYAWVKKQGPGTVRLIVRDYMERYPDGVPVEEEK